MHTSSIIEPRRAAASHSRCNPHIVMPLTCWSFRRAGRRTYSWCHTRTSSTHPGYGVRSTRTTSGGFRRLETRYG